MAKKTAKKKTSKSAPVVDGSEDITTDTIEVVVDPEVPGPDDTDVIDTTDISYMRHFSVFNREEFNPTRVDIIGVGATGSYVALAMAKLGVTNIHVWDFDQVEGHNIPNQLFGKRHIGMSKVDAMVDVVKYLTDIEITPHNERFTGEQEVGEVVFCLTDTMSSRKEIWEAIKKNVSCDCYLETRMGVDEMRVYCVEPHDDHKKYEDTMHYGDDVEESGVSACGGRTTVGMTAMVLAGKSVWTFLEWWSHSNGGKEDKPRNEVFMWLRGEGQGSMHRTFAAGS